MDLSITEQLIHNTIRIVTDVGTGTGFFFEFQIDDKKVPVVLTNKHVVRGSQNGELIFKLLDDDKKWDVGNNFAVRMTEFEKQWIFHPNDKIDLCILPTAPLLQQLNNHKKHPFYTNITEDLIPNSKDENGFTALEEIVMIGYPNGIWDEKNNLPIIRKGITATHPSYNYNGKNEFMIDAACFPGSSGSPVFLLNLGNYSDKKGNTIIGNRIKFLGILHAGPQHTATGEIKIVEIPIVQKPISQITIPNNLGFVIKSKEILKFKEILKKKIEQSE